MQEMQVQSLGWEDPLEQEIEAYSSICAWEVARAEEPGGLQSVGLQRVRQDWARTQEEEESGACSAHRVGPASGRPGRERALTRNQAAHTRILRFAASELWETNVCYLSHPVSGILLQPPPQAKTDLREWGSLGPDASCHQAARGSVCSTSCHGSIWGETLVRASLGKQSLAQCSQLFQWRYHALHLDLQELLLYFLDRENTKTN